MTDDDDDERDGCCDLNAGMAPVTDDDDTDALCLFADVDFLDPAAVAQRERDWSQLRAVDDAV